MHRRDSLGDVDPAFQQVVERAFDRTGASGAALAILQHGEMVCVASAGPDAPPLWSRLQTDSGFSGQCIRSRRLLRCDDAESDARVNRETCRALGIRSILAIPVVENEAVVGVLAVFSRELHAFTAADEAVLELLVSNLFATTNRYSRFLEPDGNSSDRRDSSGPVPMNPGHKSVAFNQSSASKFYRIVPVFACVVIGIASLLMVSRMREWFATPPPVHSDVELAPQNANQFPGALIGENELPEIRKQAEQGDPAAQFALGARYATGDNVQQDYPQAVRWFSKAAEQGHVLAQATLGAYYWAGRGVPIDLNKAYFWSILAQNGGDQASEYRVKILNSRLPTAQILGIRQEANDWLTRHGQPIQGEPAMH
jgi:TPR repeat protein